MANGDEPAGAGTTARDPGEPAGPPQWQAEDVGLLVARAFLFLSSYAPLFLILAIRFQGGWLRGVCGALCGLGLAYLIVIFANRRSQQAHAYKADAVDDASGEVAGYLATYILPFVTIPSPSGYDIAGYCILAVVVAAIFIRSDLAAINPTLYLVGWRVVVIEVGQQRYHLISRRVPRVGTEVRAVKTAGVLIYKGA
jgi:hypothetical protein